MKVTIDANAEEIQHLLTVLLVAKLCPDERQLFVGHPLFESIVDRAISEYVKVHGREAYEKRFFRGSFPEREREFLAYQVSDILQGTGKGSDQAMETLELLVRPAILSRSFAELVVSSVREIMSEND